MPTIEIKLRAALERLLGCAELNQDDIEDETQEIIGAARAVLSAVYAQPNVQTNAWHVGDHIELTHSGLAPIDRKHACLPRGTRCRITELISDCGCTLESICDTTQPAAPVKCSDCGCTLESIYDTTQPAAPVKCAASFAWLDEFATVVKRAQEYQVELSCVMCCNGNATTKVWACSDDEAMELAEQQAQDGPTIWQHSGDYWVDDDASIVADSATLVSLSASAGEQT
jgi:hypothetical protein